MKVILLYFILFFQCSLVYAQSTFYRSLDSNGDNIWGVEVVETDEGYAVIGLESCIQAGCSSWYLTDETGELLEKFTMFSDSELSIKPSDEGSYLKTTENAFVTLTINTVDNSVDILICAFDLELQDTLWCHTFGDEMRDIPTSLKAGQDGSVYAYHAKTISESPVLTLTELIKMDAQGQVVWRTDIGLMDSYNVNFNHLSLPDGTHITFRATCEPDVQCLSFLTGYGLYATKVDTAGQELWSQELRRGHYTRWNGTDPVLMDDGLVALNWIHDTLPLPAGEVRFQDMLIWMDQDGEIVRESFFPRDRERDIDAMTKAANGDLLGAGSVDLGGLELGRGGYVFRMAPDGTLLWERYLADVRFPIDSHFFNDVIEAEDGGIVLTGLLRDSFPNNDPFDFNPNVWLVKLDSMGCLEPGCSLFQVMGATVDTETPPPAEAAALLLYPNPTATFAHLQWPADARVRYPLDVSVVDLTGRPVLQRTFSAAPVVLQCRDWPAGYYVVRVRDRDGRTWVERLVVN